MEFLGQIVMFIIFMLMVTSDIVTGEEEIIIQIKTVNEKQNTTYVIGEVFLGLEDYAD